MILADPLPRGAPATHQASGQPGTPGPCASLRQSAAFRAASFNGRYGQTLLRCSRAAHPYAGKAETARGATGAARSVGV